MEGEEEKQFFINVLNHFLKDTDEISTKVLPTICALVSKFPEETLVSEVNKKENLVLTIFKQTKNFKGSWVDSQPSNKTLATQMIADKIIEQAKSK
jgi:predicted small secreted protein